MRKSMKVTLKKVKYSLTSSLNGVKKILICHIMFQMIFTGLYSQVVMTRRKTEFEGKRRVKIKNIRTNFKYILVPVWQKG